MTLRIADHLRSPRFGYDHHGIYLGGPRQLVAHYTRAFEPDPRIHITPLGLFAEGELVRRVPYILCDPAHVVLERVHSRVGASGYDVLANNCEHFAVWCKTGRHESKQVQQVRTGALATGLGAALYALW